jgi:hypothetical protein
MASHRRSLSLLLALGLGVPSITNCGTDARGIEACRSIEQARCRKAPACPSLGIMAGVGVEECVQFMRDRCLHGLAVVDPGPTALARCVEAIDSDVTCAVVRTPETAPACSFLLPSGPNVDAGADSNEGDADSGLLDSSVAGG